MRVSKSKWLSMLLVFILAFTSLPLSSVSALTGSHTVAVNKSVAPIAIKEGGEAEISLQVKGSPPVGYVKPNDVILVIDRSGSMAPGYPENNGVDKMSNAKEAAQHFVSMIDMTKHQVAVVDYSSSANTKPLSTNVKELNDYIGTLIANGGTATHDAIAKARAELKNGRPDAQPVIVLMTDGAANSFPDALREAEAAKKEGIVFYTVGLVTKGGKDEASIKQLMKNMATTEKHHYIEYSSEKLKQVYETISKEIGIASAYDVVIEDIISPEFEIVPGSYEHNIPAPTVVGNKMTWNFNELKEDLLTLTFKVKHKKGTPAGKFSLGASPIQVSYKDHLNQLQSYQLEQPTVDVSLYGPTITSLDPNKGLIQGGETVTIHGTNFKSGSKVSFGNNEIANVQFVTPEKLVVTAPAGTQGTVEVKVTNPDGQVAVNKYDYYANPIIESVTPNVGPVKGENQIVLKGSHFMNGAKVTIGGQAATTVSVTATEVKVTVPAAQKEGLVSITVTNPDNTTVTLADAYTYVGGPLVTSISPNKGVIAGGEVAKITGAKFVDGVQVYFGNKKAAAQFESTTSIQATVPAGTTAGAVDVKVVNPDGQEAALAKGYEYIYPAPQITGLTPNKGSVTARTSVMMQGDHFQQGAKVYLNDALVTGVTVYDSKSVGFQTPEGNKVGPVDVKIVNPDGQQFILKDGFTFELPEKAIIDSVRPAQGSMMGGTTVTITGKNFTKGMEIFFNQTKVLFESVTATEITLRTVPWAKAEAVNIEIKDAYGRSTIATNAFTYVAPPQPTITSITPNTGEMSGLYWVVINGTKFEPSSKVYINNVLVNSMFLSESSIEAQVPRSQVFGPVDVKIVNGSGGEVISTGGFTYNKPPVKEAPTVTSVTPNKGLKAGGYWIKVVGTNFEEGTKVTINGVAVPGKTFVSKTELDVRVPASALAGAVDVEATNPDGGTGKLEKGFTYTDPADVLPTVTAIAPNKGLTKGGYEVVVMGTNFDAQSKVFIGGVETTTTFRSGTELRAVVPARATAGTVDVRVVIGNGKDATLTQSFTYEEPVIVPPTVTSVTPNEGLKTGGYWTKVVGTNFEQGTKVTFNGVAAEKFFVSKTELDVRVPASALAGAVDVEAVNPDGGTGKLEKGFTYTDPADILPTVTGIAPNKGLTKGGYEVVVTGTNFDPQSKVSIGGVETTTTFRSATELRAVVPARATAGTVDVRVVIGNGKDATLSQSFTYEEPVIVPPTVTSVTPNEGLKAGGYWIKVVGTNFEQGTKVTINGVTVPEKFFVSKTELDVRVPASTVAGAVDVEVLNPDTGSGKLDKGFTYTEPAVIEPTVTAVAPNKGLTKGGYEVVVTGTNFDAQSKVFIGGVEATTTFRSATELRAAVPATTTAGTVDVRVVIGNGKDATLSQSFTYEEPVIVPPTVTSVTPNEGLKAGGYWIKVVGTNFNEGTKVTINGVATESYFISSTALDVRVPASTVAGAVDVEALNPDTGTGKLGKGFTYTEPAAVQPTVTAVAPNKGLTRGGYEVVVTGTNFDPQSKVFIGGVEATTTFRSATELRAAVPAATTAGIVDVRVVIGNGKDATLAQSFTYEAPVIVSPTVTSVTPNEGLKAGGYWIKAVGTNFKEGIKVTINGVASESYYISSTALDVRVPASAIAGAVDVEVTNPDSGTGKLDKGFTYTEPAAIQPTVIAIAPNKGLTRGGYEVVVTGTNFDAQSKVFIDGVEATTTFRSGTELRAAVPARATAGTVDVRVVIGNGKDATLSQSFTYEEPVIVGPTVTALTPNEGVKTGGYWIKVEGTNFKDGVKVSINGVDSETWLLSSTLLEVKVPASPTIGAVDVKVVNRDGGAVTAQQKFTYKEPSSNNANAPTIAGVTPNSGTKTGGYWIIIKGTNFDGDTKAFINGVAAETWYLSKTDLEVRVPANANAGSVEVKVVNKNGQAKLDNGFTYTEIQLKTPNITEVSPNRGSVRGGNWIYVRGTNFESSTKVFVNGVLAESYYMSPTQIEIRVPASSTAGQVEVKVVNNNGTSHTLSNGYTYQ
ncbi:IPT/TIG domain-containing protein [Paenibacillus sp. SC116]|uniref:IPT/TIG domain-containing protein n=1 Tax=Paenibacillus sp. SC116 TaxID=2968986 RepID=UPI00215A8249|nr:IPT/TIG domain-containing protein [Paenibacillus sp. SC116]MCR8844809.1 IPT/TIG domain-containing protein [Paenibacillus sp. SC116]